MGREVGSKSSIASTLPEVEWMVEISGDEVIREKCYLPLKRYFFDSLQICSASSWAVPVSLAYRIVSLLSFDIVTGLIQRSFLGLLLWISEVFTFYFCLSDDKFLLNGTKTGVFMFNSSIYENLVNFYGF